VAVNEKVNEHGRSYASAAIDQIEPELVRLVYALGRSNAQLFIGLSGVVGNVMLGVNESLWGRPIETFAAENDRSAHASSMPLDSWVSAAGRVVADISEKLSRAIGDAAIVLGDSAEAFSEAYEEKLDRDRRGDPNPSALRIY
jgi:hypothetical protein